MSAPLTAILVLCLLGIGGLLALCEVVLVHMSVARASILADEGVDRGAALVALLSRRESTLGAILVARLGTQVGIVSAVIALGVGEDFSAGTWFAIAAALVVALAFVEALSKTVGLVRTDTVALRVTPTATAVGRIPLLGLLGRGLSGFVRRRSPGSADVETVQVSEEELLAFAEVAAEAEVIESSEQALIASIIEFGDTIVREVMVPRPDMISVESTWRVSDVMEVAILNGYSRIPVLGDGIDDVIGIGYAKDLMRAERDGDGDRPVGMHIRDAHFVPEQQRVSVLLPEMQANQFHMAVVIDEYGGVAGLVTLEDLIEELVGEIVDEFDVEDPMAERLPGGAYRVNARMPLDEVNDLLGADLPEGDWESVGGLVFGTLGHVPVVGESVELGEYLLTATRVQGRRIGMVRIEHRPALDPSISVGTTETPTTGTPATGTPATETPATGTPTGATGTGAPGSGGLGSADPGSGAPGSSVSESAVPGSAVGADGDGIDDVAGMSDRSQPS